MTNTDDLLKRLEELNEIGVALSSERDIDRLLETILVAAKRITNADAGTLYLLNEEDKSLRFAIMRTDKLKIALGGTTGHPINLPPVKLYDDAGRPNHSAVAAYAALEKTTVNIADAYVAEGFDFSGTKTFDQKTGYRSMSFLTVPMCDHEGEVIGVLQLINALDRSTGEIVPFSQNDERLTQSLSSQAAVALTNQRLIEELRELFRSIIKLINTAIGIKSPYTGGHCDRVPELTMMIAEAVNRTHPGSDKPTASVHPDGLSRPPFGDLKEFSMSAQDEEALEIAGLLHDCGKIATPVHVVDKATKLQTLYDRIAHVDTRFEVLKRDAEIGMLRALQKADGDAAARAKIEEEFKARVKQLDDDREFLRRCNVGSEKMKDEDQARVKSIAAYQWKNEAGEESNFLSENEVYNLNIQYGTLTHEEREIINDHIRHTITLLEQLPWPRHLRNVPQFAGGHHERMDGKGYPKGLKREEMPWEARMMGIADIFEALTAKDRPYKKGKTLSEALGIMGGMALGAHVDPDLFDIFIREKVYLDYGKKFLDPEQIDEVDVTKIKGYTP